MNASLNNKLALSVEIKWGAFDVEPDFYNVVLPNIFNIDSEDSEFVIPFGSASNGKFIVWSQPISQPDGLNWFNTEFNYGTFPDGVMKSQVISDGRKIVGSRDIFSFDNTNYNLKITI